MRSDWLQFDEVGVRDNGRGIAQSCYRAVHRIPSPWRVSCQIVATLLPNQVSCFELFLHNLPSSSSTALNSQPFPSNFSSFIPSPRVLFTLLPALVVVFIFPRSPLPSFLSLSSPLLSNPHPNTLFFSPCPFSFPPFSSLPFLFPPCSFSFPLFSLPFLLSLCPLSLHPFSFLLALFPSLPCSFVAAPNKPKRSELCPPSSLSSGTNARARPCVPRAPSPSAVACIRWAPCASPVRALRNQPV